VCAILGALLLLLAVARFALIAAATFPNMLASAWEVDPDSTKTT
jgi:hypothetical protein